MAALAAILAACGSGGSPAGDSALPDPTAASPLAAGGGLVAKAVTLQDKKGDLVDEAGRKVGKNTRVDIVAVTASADGTDLLITIQLAGKVPADLSSNDQAITYDVEIESDGDRDTTVLVSNVEAGGWVGSVIDGTDSPAFTGDLDVDGRTIDLRVPLASLGNPRSLRLAVIAQRADNDSLEVSAEDQVPKGATGKSRKRWLALGGS